MGNYKPKRQISLLLSTLSLSSIFVVNLLADNHLTASEKIAQHYHVEKSDNSLSFSATKPHAFSGVSSELISHISVDLNNLNSFNAEFNLKVDTIETGNEKRNGHLRALLEPEKFPDTRLTANSNMIHSILSTQVNGQKKVRQLNIGDNITVSSDVTIQLHSIKNSAFRTNK